MKKLWAICAMFPVFAYANAPISSVYKTSSGFSVAAGYIKSDAKFSELDNHKEKLDGFFVNGAYNIRGHSILFAEYAKQSGDENIDFNEITFGFSRNIYENENFYTAAGIGLGYIKVEGKDQGIDEFQGIRYNYNHDYEFDYVTLPIHFEMGYKLHPLASIFANVGYKWSFNASQKLNYCETAQEISTHEMLYSECGTFEAENEDDLKDNKFSGATYKVGFRYHF